MGWSRGTEIFDTVAKEVLRLKVLDPKQQHRILRALVIELESHDWDCLHESNYYDQKVVSAVFKELHPEWND